MKTRNGFVSNSSSTSFTFIHKGEDLTDLCVLIMRWHQYFDLTYPFDFGDENRPMHITAFDVMEAIQTLSLEARSIDAHIEECTGRAERCLEWATQERDVRQHSMASEYMNSYHEAMQVVIELERLKQQGFTTVHVIDFGDNHGDIMGVGVGDIMDYAGRDINMRKDDLVIWTEQNR